jgi:hypothetical protein
LYDMFGQLPIVSVVTLGLDPLVSGLGFLEVHE